MYAFGQQKEEKEGGLKTKNLLPVIKYNVR